MKAVFNICFRVEAEDEYNITNKEVLTGLIDRLNQITKDLQPDSEYDDMVFEYLYDDED